MTKVPLELNNEMSKRENIYILKGCLGRVIDDKKGHNIPGQLENKLAFRGEMFL